jgi:DNA polymerase-4
MKTKTLKPRTRRTFRKKRNQRQNFDFENQIQDFQHTRSKTQEVYLKMLRRFYKLPKTTLGTKTFDKAIRLLGLSLSNLNTEDKKQVSVQLKIPFQN